MKSFSFSLIVFLAAVTLSGCSASLGTPPATPTQAVTPNRPRQFEESPTRAAEEAPFTLLVPARSLLPFDLEPMGVDVTPFLKTQPFVVKQTYRGRGDFITITQTSRLGQIPAQPEATVPVRGVFGYLVELDIGGRVLYWEENDTSLTIGGDLTREDALILAEALTPYDTDKEDAQLGRPLHPAAFRLVEHLRARGLDLQLKDTLLIYSWTDGLYRYDLSTGNNLLIPGTLEGDYNPRWSPNGSEIAFVRADDFNLYVMNADGSNIRRATEGREYEQLVGWMPQGRELAYVFQSTADQMQLHFLDLDTGNVREGFILDKNKAPDAAISPDGQRVAYTARVRGKLGYGSFVSDIDGSNARLLVQLDHWGVAAPAWSPGGDWLMVNIMNSDLPTPSLGLALLDPETCQAFPLDGAEGHLFGWSP